ncbi:MAG TPA: hypothetical protein VE085_02410 [Burkholderiales bacterium]|nr:hypothetical protein [Burkholderiales bacterium]
MRKVIALALCCFASGAYAQVGGGVVGSLGANGAVSRAGGLGTGISTGATLRGEDLRQTGQLSAETRTAGANSATSAATSGNAAGGIDTTVKPGGVSTDVKAGGGATASAPASTPVVNGSSWGSAEANAQVTPPDVKDTVRDTKSTARQKVDGLEERRDKLENRTDKKVDKALQ